MIVTSASQIKPDTRVESIRVADGQRVFRVLDPQTGFCLEQAVDPSKPVRQQTARLVEALQALRSMPVCTAD
jgi:hypothetical protein